MKTLAFIISMGLLLVSSLTDATERDFLVSAVGDLQPSLNLLERTAIAKAIRETDCPVAWPLILSIAFHESSLKKHKVNHKTHDYGLTQINQRTALTLGLSLDRLLKDEHYAIAAGCTVLRENHKAYAKDYTYWIGFYNAGTAVWKPEVLKAAKNYDAVIRKIAREKLGYGKDNHRSKENRHSKVS